LQTMQLFYVELKCTKIAGKQKQLSEMEEDPMQEDLGVGVVESWVSWFMSVS
jgi:hypothetical protein